MYIYIPHHTYFLLPASMFIEYVRLANALGSSHLMRAKTRMIRNDSQATYIRRFDSHCNVSLSRSPLDPTLQGGNVCVHRKLPASHSKFVVLESYLIWIRKLQMLDLDMVPFCHQWNTAVPDELPFTCRRYSDKTLVHIPMHPDLRRIYDLCYASVYIVCH
jgi:hypothetical protein